MHTLKRPENIQNGEWRWKLNIPGRQKTPNVRNKIADDAKPSAEYDNLEQFVYEVVKPCGSTISGLYGLFKDNENDRHVRRTQSVVSVSCHDTAKRRSYKLEKSHKCSLRKPFKGVVKALMSPLVANIPPTETTDKIGLHWNRARIDQ